MKFEKDGKVYENVASLLDKQCCEQQHCRQCVLNSKRGTKSCDVYANTNPKEVAHLLGYEVVEDEPCTRYNPMDEIAESAEKYLEAVKPDPVNRPAHYTSGGIECIDAMQEAFGVEAVKDFCLCNAFKYLWRHRQKNGVEDLKKARWYLNRLIREMEVEE